MTYPKFTLLVIAAVAAGAPGAFAQQAPESPPASTPAATPAATTGSSEADQTAALIAKANAAAAANANALAASTTNRSLTKIPASPEARKKASEFGFQAEVFNGSTLFCKEDAALGSRIPLKRCMTTYEFDDYVVKLKIERDMMQGHTQCTGGICGNVDKPGG